MSHAVVVLQRSRAHGGCASQGLAVIAAASIFVASLAPSARAADTDPAKQPSPDAAAEAREQYQAGTDAYDAKRFVEAALHFEAAVVQRPHAVALYTAALAWEQANRPERAADDFARALEVPGLSPSQAQNARDRLASLERTMGTLDVRAPEGWRVQLDANTGVFAPAHLHAMPGVHSLAVQPSSRPIEHRDVTLDLGKTTRLDLAAEPLAPMGGGAPLAATPSGSRPVERTPAPSAAVDSAIARREIGFAIAGAGVSSLAAGVVLGVSALSARDTYNAAPTRVAFDHATSLQTWTDVAFVAGGVFAAGGVALALWPSSKRATPGEPAVSVAPSLGGAVVRGVF